MLISPLPSLKLKVSNEYKLIVLFLLTLMKNKFSRLFPDLHKITTDRSIISHIVLRLLTLPVQYAEQVL